MAAEFGASFLKIKSDQISLFVTHTQVIQHKKTKQQYMCSVTGSTQGTNALLIQATHVLKNTVCCTNTLPALCRQKVKMNHLNTFRPSIL